MTGTLPHVLRSDAQDNRDRVLQAARELFAEAGLGVTMRQIARYAGVGPATIYRRFPAKQDLVLEAFMDEFRACTTIVREAAADPDAWRGICGIIEQRDQSRHSLATTGTEGDRAVGASAEKDAGAQDAANRGAQAQRHDKAGRATRDTDLPPSTRDLRDVRDVLPNIRMAELDARKLSDYSLNPGHPGNNGKADGWRALGYDVDNPEGRRDAAQELRVLIRDELLARGKVAETRDTAYGPSHRVLSGLTGRMVGMPLWSPAGSSKTAQASAFPSSRRYGCSLIATRRPDDDRSKGIRPDPHEG